MEKCVDNNAVRCCGASASYVVGKTNETTKPSEDQKNPENHSDILSRLNANDVQENEIPDAESGSVKMLRARNESAEILSVEETGNIANFHIKQRLNGETDDEAAESESVIETADAEFRHQQPSEDEQSQSGIVQKSHRQPKALDSVMMVYPDIMSGVPKTTPKNMPETNEMTMFDQDIGMDLHLVFSKTTTKPEIVIEAETSAPVDTTTKPSFSRFAKRRRQYRPLQRPSTESSVEDIELKTTTARSRPAVRQRIRTRNFTSRSTTQEPTDATTKQPRVKLSARVQATQDTDTTTKKPRVRLSTRAPTTQATVSTTQGTVSTTQDTDAPTKKPRTQLSTRAPTTEEPEILITSEDDKSHQSRFRLFNARHRLNYLRRTTTPPSTATTESPIEVTTRPTTQERKRPSRVNDTQSKILVRPSKMNETLILVMDTNHRNMLTKVHLALKEESTKNHISEIPRSFAGVEMHNRVKKIEKILLEQMLNVYTESKSKRRGVQPKTKEVNNDFQVSSTEEPISRPNSTRPFRGHKKFQMSDMLDKTPIVPISENEFRRIMRMRTTTVKPTERITDDIVTPTKRPRRRRPISTIQETNTSDATLPENKEGTNIRQRVVTRRRYNAERSSETTTLSPPTTVSESISPLSTTRTPSTIPTETTTPETITLIESAFNLNETESDANEESESISQDESVQNRNEPTLTLDIEVSSTSPMATNADALSDFKPSPLWSISTDENDDFDNKEDNHSYDMNMDERALRNGHRRSRNTFDPPAIHLNGFVPLRSLNGPIQIIGPIPKSSKSGDDAKLRYNLPRDTKAQFSKS